LEHRYRQRSRFCRVLLKLTKDVAFCIPPVSRDKARELLGRTHAARLLAGYRGSAALDVETVVDALVDSAGWRAI